MTLAGLAIHVATIGRQPTAVSGYRRKPKKHGQ